jgi:hypothetical protein
MHIQQWSLFEYATVIFSISSRIIRFNKAYTSIIFKNSLNLFVKKQKINLSSTHLIFDKLCSTTEQLRYRFTL